MVIQRHGMIRRRKDDRAGDQILGRRTGKLLRGRLALRNGHVAGCLHEAGELLVGYIGLIHPEAIHIDAMDGACIVRCVHSRFIVAGGSIAPMENSPPGIHAIRCGDDAGTAVMLGIVGPKVAVVLAADVAGLASTLVTGERTDERNRPKSSTAAVPAMKSTIHNERVIIECAGRAS